MGTNTIHYLTQEELRRLFGVIRSKRDKAIFHLSYKYGLRSVEVGLLRRDHVDFARRRIFIPRVKGSLSQEYPLWPDVAKLLKSYLRTRKDEDPTLFLSRQGDPISPRTLRWHMAKYGELAGIPEEKRHFHVLKHSIGMHMIEAGAHLEQVRDWLGHKNIQNTLVYARLVGKTREELARRVFASPKIV